jgi:hypothetical protein
VVVSAVLVSGLTACNSKSSGGSTDGAAAANQAPAKPANLDPKTALLASAAVMDKAGSAKVAMTTTGSAAGSGSGVMSWKAPQGLQMETDQKGQKVQVVLVDGVFYTSIPAAQAATLGGKKWMKIDPKATAAAGDQGATWTNLQQMLNPGVMLAADAQAGQVTKVGDEQVDGTPAAHYQTTVPVEALVNVMTGLSDTMKKQITDQMKQQGTSVVSDLWINAKGQVVQAKSKNTGAATGKTDDGDVTVKYSDFGTSVSIQAPPAADVFDLAQMMKH